MTLRIGAGAGYSGDRIDPAQDLAERGALDVLVFECLAERTIALAQGRGAAPTTLVVVPGGDHFLNACCVPALLVAFEQAIAEAEGRESPQPPAAPLALARRPLYERAGPRPDPRDR